MANSFFVILSLILAIQFAGLQAATSNCPVTITQNVRESWTTNGITQYLYDITIRNTGSEAATTPIFFIKSTDPNRGTAIIETWNLVVYATTVPSQVLVSLPPNTVIAPGASYTSAGYVTNGTTTTVVFDSCFAYGSGTPSPSTGSSTTTGSNPTSAPINPTSAPINPTSAPINPTSAPINPTSAPANPTTAPANPTAPTQSCSNIRLTQVLRTSWTTEGQQYHLYDITISNVGTPPITTPYFLILTNGGHIYQTWNLVTYASTVAGQVGVTVNPTTTLNPGQSFSGSGYVIQGAESSLTFPTTNGQQVC